MYLCPERYSDPNTSSILEPDAPSAFNSAAVGIGVEKNQ